MDFAEPRLVEADGRRIVRPLRLVANPARSAIGVTAPRVTFTFQSCEMLAAALGSASDPHCELGGGDRVVCGVQVAQEQHVDLGGGAVQRHLDTGATVSYNSGRGRS